jgi:toxin ParE1/3/4
VARADLEAIWLFTADRWSVAQADAYVGELLSTIDLLVENLKIARERIEFTPTARIHPCRSHIIIFRDEDTYLDVIRIRHSREDWMSDPAGEV